YGALRLDSGFDGQQLARSVTPERLRALFFLAAATRDSKSATNCRSETPRAPGPLADLPELRAARHAITILRNFRRSTTAGIMGGVVRSIRMLTRFAASACVRRP